MLCSLYNGNVNVWNHENQQLVKTFEVCDLPVRAAKFVPRKNWILAGSDDMQIRVFNYNTLDRVHAFEAHSDYVRCIVVHPTQPYILTGSGELYDAIIQLYDVAICILKNLRLIQLDYIPYDQNYVLAYREFYL